MIREIGFHLENFCTRHITCKKISKSNSQAIKQQIENMDHEILPAPNLPILKIYEQNVDKKNPKQIRFSENV